MRNLMPKSVLFLLIFSCTSCSSGTQSILRQNIVLPQEVGSSTSESSIGDPVPMLRTMVIVKEVPATTSIDATASITCAASLPTSCDDVAKLIYNLDEASSTVIIEAFLKNRQGSCFDQVGGFKDVNLPIKFKRAGRFSFCWIDNSNERHNLDSYIDVTN